VTFGFKIVKILKFFKIRKTSLKICWVTLGLFTMTMASFKKTHKQQQNVMLKGTGLHMTSSIARSKRKLDKNIEVLSSRKLYSS